MPVDSADAADSPSRWGFISRIRKPFTQKARHFPEFYIQPDDPHRQYQPGDVVTGEVVLKIHKPVDITHIVVNLHGFAQVYKTPNTPGVGYKEYNAALVTGKTNKAGGYYGNGFASLFEDEVVLCGDGRLGEGLYRFGFELHFPREHAPSSIDFERGTVTYMITSTVTRPSRASIINPITTCERRVTFLDDIDIANLVRPKPRIVTLEPIIRRTRARSRRRIPDIPEGQQISAPTNAQTTVQSQPQPQMSSDPHSQNTTPSLPDSQTPTPMQTPRPAHQFQRQSSTPEISDNRSRSRTIDSAVTPNDNADPPRSPGPSEESFDTVLSSGGVPSATESAVYTQSVQTSDSRSTRPNATSRTIRRKPITTSVEINSAGFLRGDTIEIKIRISHTKHIKSLHGVIATLYRQARVDMYPALPLVNDKDDELYPKSRTGLSGLSLSSTGSCHLYRKDFDQSFASIIINPDTLFAEIKTSLRVPEDAFPSISTVPGAMISFKYYVEVILDIQGKLTALDKFLPTPNVSSFAPAMRGGPGVGPAGAHANMYTGWGGHSIDTEDIRREKSVVSCNFEVVVGSRDSKRVGRWRDQTASAFPDGSLPNIVEPNSRAVSNNNTVFPSNSSFSHSNSRLDAMLSESPANMRPRSSTQEEFPSIAPRHLQVPNRTQTLPVSHSPDDMAPDYEASNSRAIHFPLPILPPDSEVSEKERLRRAEERLLPSQPPGMNGESSSVNHHASYSPSAPSAPDFVPLNRQRSFGASSAGASHAPLSYANSSNHSPLVPPSDHTSLAHSSDHLAPAYELHQASSSSHSLPTEDKQELERRRLESERSAPDMSNHEASGSSGLDGASSATGPSAPPPDASSSDGHAPSAPVLGVIQNEFEPSAPVLTDEDMFGFNEQTPQAELPRYER